MDAPQLFGRNIKADVASGDQRNGDRDRGDAGGRRRGNYQKRGSRGDKGGRGDGGGYHGGERGGDDSLSSPTDIDGAQFMGGRYARSHSSSGDIGEGGWKRSGSGGAMATGGGAEGGLKRGTSHGSAHLGGVGGDASAPFKQRPSLKLAPRTKPLDDASKNDSSVTSSKASIFGGAKPRDETEYEKRKSMLKIESEVNDATSSVAALEVNDSDENGDNESKGGNAGVALVRDADITTVDTNDDRKAQAPALFPKGDDTPQANHDRSDDASTNTPPSVSSGANAGVAKPPTSPKRHSNYERRGSRGGRGRQSYRDNGDRNDRRADGRSQQKDGQRKPGGRGGGRLGERSRTSDRAVGGRCNGSAKDSSRNGQASSNIKASAATAKSATAPAVARVPLNMTAKKENKDPPKKSNSFAALLDDSDNE